MVRNNFITGSAVALGLVMLAFESGALNIGAAFQQPKVGGAIPLQQAKAGAFAIPQQPRAGASLSVSQQKPIFMQPQPQQQQQGVMTQIGQPGSQFMPPQQQARAGGSAMVPQMQAAVMPVASMPFQMQMPMQSGFLGQPPPMRGGGDRDWNGDRHGRGHDHDDWRHMGGPQMPGFCVDQTQCNNQWQTALLNEMMDYDNWKCITRPVTGGTQNCVLTGTYLTPAVAPATITTGCWWTMPVFCDDSVNDIVNSLVGATQPAGTFPAPTGYTLAGAGYYKVHTEQLTWAAAQNACVAEGAHLAVPSNATDYAALVTVLAATTPATTGAYVGITDSAVEGVFVSVMGQPMCTLGQIQYNTNEPNGGITENCLQVGNPLTGTLNDVSCTTLLPFVCEVTLPSRLTPCRV